MPDAVIPVPIQIAMDVLAQNDHIPDDARPSWEKAMRTLAMRLHRQGRDVTPELLFSYMEGGFDAVRAASDDLASGKKKADTSLPLTARYDKTVKYLGESGILDVSRWTVDDLTHACENDRYKAKKLLRALNFHERIDLMRAGHEARLIDIKALEKPAVFYAAHYGVRAALEYYDDIGIDVTAPDHNITAAHAAYDGHLHILEYLYAAGVDLTHKNLVYTLATGKHDTDILRFMIGKGLHVPSRLHFNAFKAAHYGDLELLKDVLSVMEPVPESLLDDGIKAAACSGQMPVIRYLHEEKAAPLDSGEKGEDSYNNAGIALMLMAANGHKHVLDYYRAEGVIFSQDDIKAAALRAAQFGRNDMIDALYPLLTDKNEDVGDILAGQAYDADQWKTLEYIKEHYTLSEAVQAEIAKFFESEGPRIERWRNRLHMEPPPGLYDHHLQGVKSSVYEDVKTLIYYEGAKTLYDLDDDSGDDDADETVTEDIDVFGEEEDDSSFRVVFQTNRAIYKLSRLFGSSSRVLDYLAKWGDNEDETPLLTLGRKIRIPLHAKFNIKAWGDAALRYGPSVAAIAHYADRMDLPPNRKATYREQACDVFTRGYEYPRLAEICARAHTSEDTFDFALDLYKLQYDRGFSQKNIPDITVSGDRFGMERARFSMLAPDDPRGLLLGHYVDCCQHLVHQNGGSAAYHGFTSQNGAFYTLETKKGEIIGISWVWRGQDGALVFDSLETLGERLTDQRWQDVMIAYAETLAENPGDVTRILVGTDSNHDFLDMSLRETAKPSMPLDYKEDAYRDSKEQFHVWSAERSAVEVFKKRPEDAAALDKLFASVFDDGTYDYEDGDDDDCDESMLSEEEVITLYEQELDAFCQRTGVNNIPETELRTLIEKHERNELTETEWGAFVARLNVTDEELETLMNNNDDETYVLPDEGEIESDDEFNADYATTYVAFNRDGAVLGFALLLDQNKQEDTEENGFYLKFMAVDKQAAPHIGRYRVAHQLLAAVEDHIKRSEGVKNLSFCVHEDNERVLKALSLLGMEYCQTIDDYFGDHKAGLSFSKDLTKASLFDRLHERRQRVQPLADMKCHHVRPFQHTAGLNI